MKIHLAEGQWQESGEIVEFKVGQGVDVKLPEIYSCSMYLT